MPLDRENSGRTSGYEKTLPRKLSREEVQRILRILRRVVRGTKLQETKSKERERNNYKERR